MKELVFNSPLEVGLKAVSILVAAFPRSFDLQQMVAFDHLVVHTGDLGGPESLHPKVKLRSGELLVRRHLVERGVNLMISRSLIERKITQDGIYYSAGELSETFLRNLTSNYINKLSERALWAVENFADLDEDSFRKVVYSVFDRWREEFQAVQSGQKGQS